MNSISGYDKWLTTPPDEPPCCEDGCGDTLEKDINGDWVCANIFCPLKFQGVEKAMAEDLVEYMDKAYTSEKQLRYRKLELDDLKQEIADLTIICKQWQEMYHKMTNERDELEYKLENTNK